MVLSDSQKQIKAKSILAHFPLCELNLTYRCRLHIFEAHAPKSEIASSCSAASPRDKLPTVDDLVPSAEGHSILRKNSSESDLSLITGRSRPSHQSKEQAQLISALHDSIADLEAQLAQLWTENANLKVSIPKLSIPEGILHSFKSNN